MSFAVWNEKPPFAFAKNDREQIYQVGDKWVVTDDPLRATQEEVDAVLNAPSQAPRLTDGDLADVLVRKGVLSADDVTTAMENVKASV